MVHASVSREGMMVYSHHPIDEQSPMCLPSVGLAYFSRLVHISKLKRNAAAHLL